MILPMRHVIIMLVSLRREHRTTDNAIGVILFYILVTGPELRG